jgi:protein-S-isoprenylcysteine O-methyltransferase Ste14
VNSLLARAIVAFLVLPGTIAFIVPLAVLAPGGPKAFTDWWGLLPLGFGVVLLLACVRRFYVAGRGTLAPWSPPTHLVTSGPYRYSRNPMYIAVTLILCGWALGFRSPALTVYAVSVAILFHLRVVLNEEPYVARTHGDGWSAYKGRVRRWL